MFAYITFSDKNSSVIIREPDEDLLKKKIEEYKKDYDIRESRRIKDRTNGVKAVFFKAVKKPHYIWE